MPTLHSGYYFRPWLYKPMAPYQAGEKNSPQVYSLKKQVSVRKVVMTEAAPALRISCVCFQMRCFAVCSHLYSDWVWIMLSVLYNLEYCMQNGPYWLCHSAEYKKGSAPAYTDNPLRKQRPAGSSNEYKTPHKSQALAWHPASVLSCLRQWEYAWLWWKTWEGLGCCLCLHFLFLR